MHLPTTYPSPCVSARWRSATGALALLLVATASCTGDTAAPPAGSVAMPPTTTSGSTAAAAPASEPTTEPSPSSAPPSIPASVPASGPSTTSDASGTSPIVGSELVGRWAHYDVVAYEDGTLKTLIVSYGFNDFAEVRGRIVDQASFCFSEQRTDQPIETALSDAATQAIRPPPTAVEVELDDGTLRIRRPSTPTPVGIRLDDPANESLPTDPADTRIVDDDGDGNPGITVSIRVTEELTGELYIARREIFAYDARLVTPDRIEGTVTDDSEQLVIGASDPIFAMPSEWVQHPDPARSPIVLVRVDDTWDCDRLAAERDVLFPPTPEVDW